MDRKYNIGEFAGKFNLNRERVRYYERIGLIPAPKREPNGYRLYSNGDMDRLRFILMAKQHGFSLKEIKALMDRLFCEIAGCDTNQIKKIVERKIDDIDRNLAELNQMKALLVNVNQTLLTGQGDSCTLFEAYLNNENAP